MQTAMPASPAWPAASPITTSTVPTGTTSPSATRIRATFPPAGEGISTVVLSVCTSTSGSSSAISWPSETSQRAISPSVSPSPRSGSLNSYATAGLLPNRVVAQHRVHAEHAVHDLGHSQVDRDTRERERLVSRHVQLALHHREDPVDRDPRRAPEMLVEPEGEPCAVDPGERPLEPEVVSQVDCQRRLSRSLDRRTRHLAVPLRRVSVAGREECVVDGDREEERRPGDELLAVDVSTPATRRKRRVNAGLGRRHAHHAEKRREIDLPPQRPANPVRELPTYDRSAAVGHAPVTGLHLVDRYRERLPRL